MRILLQARAPLTSLENSRRLRGFDIEVPSIIVWNPRPPQGGQSDVVVYNACVVGDDGRGSEKINYPYSLRARPAQ